MKILGKDNALSFPSENRISTGSSFLRNVRPAGMPRVRQSFRSIGPRRLLLAAAPAPPAQQAAKKLAARRLRAPGCQGSRGRATPWTPKSTKKRNTLYMLTCRSINNYKKRHAAGPEDIIESNRRAIEN